MLKNIFKMNEEEKKLAEEAKAQEAIKEEDVREKIIEDFGFTEDDDSDKIDKLVGKEMEHSKKLSEAIGQKIKQRDKVKELEEQLNKPPEPKPETKVEDLDKTIDEKLNARLEKETLDDLEYSDELKEKIQRVAKIDNISIKQALKDPDIIVKIEQYNKNLETDEASISRNNKKKGEQKFSMENPPDVDVKTPEGQKKWEEWKEEMRKQGN